MSALRKSIVVAAALVVAAIGCKPSLPPSTPLSELNAQQTSGHEVYLTRCASCHYPNSEAPLHGPGLQGLFKKKYLPSGARANDDRVMAVIQRGRNMMPAFGNNIDDQQLADLLAYLHTL